MAGGARPSRAGRIKEWLLGAAPEEPRTLAGSLGLAADAAQLQRLRRCAARELARVERLHAAAQRAFERRTRTDACGALEHAVRAALLESDAAPSEEAGARLAAERLAGEADAVGERLEADAALAGARALNTGLAFGILLSPVVLVAVLILARTLPPLLHRPLGCPEQLSLAYALVCFAGGAMGATFSVIIRIRDIYQLMPNRHRTGSLPPDPAMLAQAMRQEGWYRVMVGWFLASSLFLLINGGVLTLLTPPATPEGVCGPAPLSLADHQALIKAWFFWGSVGFLAGLNERWAYGLLRRGGRERQGDPAPAGDEQGD